MTTSNRQQRSGTPVAPYPDPEVIIRQGRKAQTAETIQRQHHKALAPVQIQTHANTSDEFITLINTKFDINVFKPSRENFEHCWDGNHQTAYNDLENPPPLEPLLEPPVQSFASTSHSDYQTHPTSPDQQFPPTSPPKSPPRPRSPSKAQPDRNSDQEPYDPSPPDPDNPSDPPDTQAEPDSDDEDMSKVKKAFEGITKLEPDGSNWSIFITRVKRATLSLGGNYSDLLSSPKKILTLDNSQHDQELLHAITLLLPDSIFHRYMHKTHTYEVISALEDDYNISNAISEARTISHLFTIKCHDESKLNMHLDTLLKIREDLQRTSQDVTDSQFIDAIIASVPQRLAELASALKTQHEVHNKFFAQDENSKHELKIADLIRCLRSEVVGAKAKSSNPSHQYPNSANYTNHRDNGNNGRGRGRERGNYPNSQSRDTYQHPNASQSHPNTNNSPHQQSHQHNRNNNQFTHNINSDICSNCRGTGHWSRVCPSERRPQANSAEAAPPTSTPDHPPQSDQTTSHTTTSLFAVPKLDKFSNIEESWHAFPDDKKSLDNAIWEATRPPDIDISDLLDQPRPEREEIISSSITPAIPHTYTRGIVIRTYLPALKWPSANFAKELVKIEEEYYLEKQPADSAKSIPPSPPSLMPRFSTPFLNPFHFDKSLKISESALFPFSDLTPLSSPTLSSASDHTAVSFNFETKSSKFTHSPTADIFFDIPPISTPFIRDKLIAPFTPLCSV
ncbi:hypothetical protein CPB83DRAFT_898575 [Crepidotus variabilis]|uniref:CCHC-type domain-containing protein n=1 Tax=Crepidotus variabilis TaxID=179855 RepID=A0A9P6E6P2_9AGAR|nr:hypothetical protein CPB83DRAFT_898575 [Crepidotus variabilis]